LLLLSLLWSSLVVILLLRLRVIVVLLSMRHDGGVIGEA
jgi:hypothetical protein